MTTKVMMMMLYFRIVMNTKQNTLFQHFLAVFITSLVGGKTAKF